MAPRVPVTVDPEIAKEAIARDSAHCMWADAVKKAVPNARHVTVDLQTIRFTDPEKRLRYTYLTPRSAQLSLIKFDLGEHIEQPITVLLRRGQVTRAEGYSKTPPKKGVLPMPHGMELVKRDASNEERRMDVVGGTTPPTGPLANMSYRGKRRAFGLRGLIL
jgi:hypothetical protein